MLATAKVSRTTHEGTSLKGDVVASLVILVVNILGGLAIGVAMRGLPVAAALRRYGLLTIGDGLVTQIPALVLSTAAGVLVTRVASEEADTPLGRELARQLFGVPRALQVAGGFVLLLAVVPGLPAAPFLVLGIAMAALGRAQVRARAAEQRRAVTEPAPADRARARSDEPAFVPLVVPWTLEIGKDLAPFALGPASGIHAAVRALREELFAELGVPLPPPRVRVRADVAPRRIVLSLHEVPAAAFAVPDDATEEGAAAVLREGVLPPLRARAADFLGLAEVQRLLDELEPFAPATVRNVVPKPVTLVVLTDVLRRLLDEQVSVRDLRGILETLSTVAATERDPLNLAEYVRSQLRRAITYRLTGGRGELDVVLLDAIVEETVRRAITRTPNGAFLTLAPPAARDVLASIRRAVAELVASQRPVVILTQPDVRRFVRKLVEPELPEAAVVSFAELLPEVALKPVARAVPI